MRQIVTRLLVMILGLWSLACYADSPPCAINPVLLQATESTPAQITGDPGERVTLSAYDPQYKPRVSKLPSSMYLLTGDKVQVIATCKDYAYVRYQGQKLLSTGWVETGRLKYIGSSNTRPTDTVAQVCAAAANTVNRNGAEPFFFTRVPLIPASAQAQSKATKGDQNVAVVKGMARIMIHGYAVKVFVILGEGSASSVYLRIWNDDLSKLITDTDASLGFGDGEELVQVLGHPLVMTVHYTNPKKFSLSAIGADGKLRPICMAERGYAPKPRISTGDTNPVCQAVVTNHVRTIYPRNVVDGSVVLPADLKRYSSRFKLTLAGYLRIDLFNDGKPLKVGLITYDAYHGDPYGGHPVHAIFPSVMDARGNVNLSNATNEQIAKETTGFVWFDNAVSSGLLYSPRGIRFIAYAGHTYLVTYNEPLNSGKPSIHTLVGVMRFRLSGSEYVCKFQTNFFLSHRRPGRGPKRCHDKNLTGWLSGYRSPRRRTPTTVSKGSISALHSTLTRIVFANRANTFAPEASQRSWLGAGCSGWSSACAQRPYRRFRR